VFIRQGGKILKETIARTSPSTSNHHLLLHWNLTLSNPSPNYSFRQVTVPYNDSGRRWHWSAGSLLSPRRLSCCELGLFSSIGRQCENYCTVASRFGQVHLFPCLIFSHLNSSISFFSSKELAQTDPATS
jgi:hypothetical protein